MRHIILILILIAGGIFTGCDNTGEAGVDTDKKVSELSQEELTKLCEWGVGIMASIESAKCESDDNSVNTDGATSTAKDDGVESSASAVEDCVEDLPRDFKDCGGTVEVVETCLTARSQSPCTSENDIPECKPLLACEAEDDDPEQPATDAGVGSVWDSCYYEGGNTTESGGCSSSWRCPYGADRDLICEPITDGYQCTCKNVKEGTEEGTFTSDDICGLESHNVAYRVNQSCGWQLPEN